MPRDFKPESQPARIWDAGCSFQLHLPSSLVFVLSLSSSFLLGWLPSILGWLQFLFITINLQIPLVHISHCHLYSIFNNVCPSIKLKGFCRAKELRLAWGNSTAERAIHLALRQLGFHPWYPRGSSEHS